MSFQSLQNAYQLQQPTRENVDPTKELLKQGSNFAKEMAGERGIMGAIEGAHFRPIIQKYIKSKLADPSGFVNSIQKDVQGVRQKAAGAAERIAATGQQAKQLVKRGGDIIDESLQGAKGELRGDPNVGRPPLSDRPAEFGKRAEPAESQLERETQTGGFGAEPLEATPKPPSFGEGLRVPRGVDPEGPFESLFPNPPVTEEEFGKPILSAAQRARQATTEGGQKLGDVLRGGQPEQARAVPKPTPEPSVPSASTPSAEQPIAQQPEREDEIRPATPEVEGRLEPEPIAEQPIAEQPRGEVDEFGLPKQEPIAEQPIAEQPKQPKGEIEKDIGKDIGKEEEKTAPTEEAEAEAPGIGDVLAVGTALYGAIKGAVEAHHAMKEAKGYVAPAMPKIAMDSAATFDSAFRGN